MIKTSKLCLKIFIKVILAKIHTIILHLEEKEKRRTKLYICMRMHNKEIKEQMNVQPKLLP